MKNNNLKKKRFISSGLKVGWLFFFFKGNNKAKYVMLSCSHYEKERIL